LKWLGEIPEHWEVKQLKRLTSLRAGYAITSENIEEVGEYPVFGGNGVRGFTSSYTHEGEFPLIGRQGALCGCVKFAHGKFWASEHAVVATPKPEVNPYWLMYLLGAMSLNAYSESAAQPGLGVETISALRVCMPFITEQRTITAFLDREAAKIDALIAKKEQFIELLQEKRAALISHAVTKGLDPSAPMKDSGVEWLGEIPEHWEVKQLKRLASLRAGYAITSEIIEEVGEYPVFGGNGIRGFTSSYTHEGEFPLIGRQGALCGCVSFAHGRFWASEHAVVVTPKPEVSPYWLTFLLGAMSLNTYSESAAQPGLGVETISVLRVPMPHIAEQRAIADFLDSEIAKIDTLRSKINNAIDKLKEYRTALISAAVTGKIDVRDEAGVVA
jgi:type I restriction enzyme, S subunit